MANRWQILHKTACIYPMSIGLKFSKPAPWGANWQLIRPTPHLSQDRRNKIQNGQVRIWCPPEQNLSHTIYTDFPVSTCLQSRWHLLDTVRCAQTAWIVHSKWPSPLETLKPQFYLCFFLRADSVERSQPFTQCHRHSVPLLFKSFEPWLPWCLSAKGSVCQCRRHGFNPWSRKIPHAMEQRSPCPQLLSLCSRAQELQLLSPRATTTEARVP